MKTKAVKNIILCSHDLDYGIGTQVKAILKYYEKDEHVEKVFLLSPWSTYKFGPKIHFIPIILKGNYFITKAPIFAYQCNKIIEDLIMRQKIDLISLHSSIKAQDYGIPTEAVFHGMHKSIIQNYPILPKYIIASIFHKIYSHYDKKTMHYSKKIYFVSDKIMNEARCFYPQYQSKFILYSNIVDMDHFFPLNIHQKDKIKNRLGLNNSKILLYIGRLEPFKGVLEIIEIVKRINDPQVTLIIIGDGSLSGQVQSYPFVKYLGHLPNEDLCKYYNVADVFVFPSKNESYGLALMEAIYCGTKSIAYKPDGKKYLTMSDKIIRHGENGYLVKDLKEMSETIKAILYVK